ncbi:MAG: hypothetical protein K9L82_15320 [Chromatiaceae bacterium]|nr:hypothetical protein [Chromatiaceae bacterium]MCF7996326.1 hypothetical protein [Chromatiaceae bacterium]MCF8016843.1 hypothetical protein [Chromatiaceae bacterium]
MIASAKAGLRRLLPKNAFARGVSVLLGGAYNVFNYWSVRTKRFGAIAETKIRQSITSIAIQLTAFKLGGLGPLLAQVAGYLYGIAAECALKAIMREAGLQPLSEE